jgi:hypothetical protein
MENGEFTKGQPSHVRQAWPIFVGFLIAAGIGKSHDGVAKEPIAAASLKEISPVLEVMRQSLGPLLPATRPIKRR